MIRIKGLSDSSTIDIPVGHHWILKNNSAKQNPKKVLIAFGCERCSALYVLQYESVMGKPNWIASFQYFEDSCVESEVILAKQPDTMA